MSGEDASAVVIAFSTAPDAATAERIARALLDEGLIACASLVPGLTSVYRWEGRVHADPEVLLLIKTRREKVPRLKERLPELHPYEVPELVVAPVEDGLAPYCKWVLDETRP
ncbi:MAG: divalent-cation tolerance protein CutA [Gemmatimonadetes bacterium]|nr:divalent-cation tolerance protein CutA [Gemmatimonadota bacterium]